MCELWQPTQRLGGLGRVGRVAEELLVVRPRDLVVRILVALAALQRDDGIVLGVRVLGVVLVARGARNVLLRVHRRRGSRGPSTNGASSSLSRKPWQTQALVILEHLVTRPLVFGPRVDAEREGDDGEHRQEERDEQDA